MKHSKQKQDKIQYDYEYFRKFINDFSKKSVPYDPENLNVIINYNSNIDELSKKKLNEHNIDYDEVINQPDYFPEAEDILKDKYPIAFSPSYKKTKFGIKIHNRFAFSIRDKRCYAKIFKIKLLQRYTSEDYISIELLFCVNYKKNSEGECFVFKTKFLLLERATNGFYNFYNYVILNIPYLQIGIFKELNNVEIYNLMYECLDIYLLDNDLISKSIDPEKSFLYMGEKMDIKVKLFSECYMDLKKRSNVRHYKYSDYQYGGFCIIKKLICNVLDWHLWEHKNKIK